MIELGKSYYFKFNVNDLNTTSPISQTSFSVNTSQLKVFKYRINGGTWNTDTTTGVVSMFGINTNNQFYIKLKDGSTYTYTSNETIEIYTSYVSAISSPDSVNFPIISAHSIESPIKVELYNYVGESDLCDKDDYLQNIEEVYGQFTEEVDVMNPSIILQYDSDFLFNYVVITSLYRKYFITKVTNIRKNLWRIDLHVDVLFTYSNDIKHQIGLVNRNEDVTASVKLIDDRIPYSDIPRVEYKEINDRQNPETNASFDFSDVTDGYKFVFKEFDDLTKVTNPQAIPCPVVGLPDIPNLYKNEPTLYLMDFSSMYSIVSANAENDVATTFISSMLYLPIDLHTLYGYTGSPSSDIYSGKYVLSDGKWQQTPYSGTIYPKAYKIEQSNSPYLIIKDFVFDNNIMPYDTSSTTSPYYDYGSSINGSDKVHYELYLPFVGYVELKYTDMANSTIQIMYNVDFDTGMGMAIVYNASEEKVIYSKQCKIGYQLPINSSNDLEITKQKENNNRNVILSLLGSAVGMKMGTLSTGSLGALAGVTGAIGVLHSIGAYVNANNLMFERGSVSDGGDIGMFYLLQEPHFKITYNPIVNTSSDEISAYHHRNGKPHNKFESLGNLSGYTEVMELHYEPVDYYWITTTEISEIEELAKNGIIL